MHFVFQIRAKVVGVVVTIAWFMTFTVVSIYAPMCDTFGQFSPFVFYGVVNFGGFIYTWIFLPETKGKSEEEIRIILTRDTKDMKNGLADTFSHTEEVFRAEPCRLHTDT